MLFFIEMLFQERVKVSLDQSKLRECLAVKERCQLHTYRTASDADENKGSFVPVFTRQCRWEMEYFPMSLIYIQLGT
jgi:hypothetical protein